MSGVPRAALGDDKFLEGRVAAVERASLFGEDPSHPFIQHSKRRRAWAPNVAESIALRHPFMDGARRA
jgi:hypothetical protein